MMNSREKGKRGERLWRDVLRAFGFTARRGQQFSGGDDSPDVICDELNDEYHFEVKFVEKLNIHDAMNQAAHDAGSKIPLVAHKRTRTDWLVTMKASDFLKHVDRHLTEPTIGTLTTIRKHDRETNTTKQQPEG